MREITVRIQFTGPSLGNVKDHDQCGNFVFLRNNDGRIIFLASWHRGNMRMAARMLGRHHTEVDRILWDVCVDGHLRHDRGKWYCRAIDGKKRRAKHEAFFPGQEIGINCAVPPNITDDDLLQLMNLAGRYKGLSPWKPGEFGHYEVLSIRPRRRRVPAPDDNRAVLSPDRAVK